MVVGHVLFFLYPVFDNLILFGLAPSCRVIDFGTVMFSLRLVLL